MTPFMKLSDRPPSEEHSLRILLPKWLGVKSLKQDAQGEAKHEGKGRIQNSAKDLVRTQTGFISCAITK